MRKSCLFAFLTLLIVFPVGQSAMAGTWVEGLNGSVDAFVISRSGDLLKAEEMMRLHPGDIVKVRSRKASMRILLGSGAVKTISKAQSPYTVEGGETGGSFLGNLMGEVKNMLLASSNQTKAVAAASRGKGKQLVFHAAADTENRVLAGTDQLYVVVWCKGNKCSPRKSRSPYRLSLLHSENENALLSINGRLKKQLILNTGTMEDKDLGEEAYELTAKGSGRRPPASAALRLSFVGSDDLDDDVQQLLQLGLEKRVEARLLITILYEQPEWRLFAHSLAVQYGLTKERDMLRAIK